jgi:hypothetical protein
MSTVGIVTGSGFQLNYLDIYRSLPGVRGERCEIDGSMAVYRIGALSPKASVARQ